MAAQIEFYRPETLDEALELLARPNGRAIAGGTNLVVELREDMHDCETFVDLALVPGLRFIHEEDGYVVLGGRATITDLLQSDLIAAKVPVLHEAAALFANPLVRNRATLGGNLVDASPAADTAPPLLALGAEVQLTCKTGSRWLPLEDFLLGVRKTALQSGELLTAARFPLPKGRTASAYAKVGLRKADAISVLSAAAVVELDADGKVASARIALGAVAPRPFRAHAAESSLLNRPLTTDLCLQAAQSAAEAARPISDIRASADYRKRVTAVTVRRLLEKIAEELA